MAAVTFDRLSVSLRKRPILADVSATVPDGAFVAVVGPSGTGKSTLLRAVAGLVKVDRGAVRFDGDDITEMPTAKRDIGMVFQTPALLPTRNVRRNVQFPLEIRRETATAIHDRVTAEARALRIEHLLLRNPRQLSRGEEQLVQIARTMVRAPRVLLLDEPFAPLDAHLRQRMRAEIKMLQAGYAVTTIMATNDPADASALASHMIVLACRPPDGSDARSLLDGPARVVQVGTPVEIHQQPVDLDVASSTGPLWTLAVDVIADGDGFWLVRDDAVRMRSWAPALRAHTGSTVLLGVRTEGLTKHENGDATARLDRIIPGSPGTLLCRWGDRMINANGDANAAEPGSTIRLKIANPLLFDADTGQRIG